MVEPITIKLSTVANAFGKGLEYFRNKRINKLVDDLAAGNIHISDELIQNEAFLSSFITTVDAIQKSSGYQKIDFLTQLLIHGFNTGDVDTKTDQFHELISIVSGMSERELIVLAICGASLTDAVYNLDKLNEEKPSQNSIIVYDKIEKTLDISKGEAIAYVAGLQRTGFVVPMVKSSPLPIFMLSHKYESLRKYILKMQQLY